LGTSKMWQICGIALIAGCGLILNAVSISFFCSKRRKTLGEFIPNFEGESTMNLTLNIF